MRSKTLVSLGSSILLSFDFVCCENHQTVNFDGPTQQRPLNDNPRLIGLDVNGRIRTLLWNNPKTSQEDPTLNPLFSSSRLYEDDENDGGFEQHKNFKTDTASFILPSAVYGTADYHFRKERWYGIEKLGMILRWNARRRLSYCDGGDDEFQNFPKKRFWGLPARVDFAAHHCILPSSKISHHRGVNSFIDSGNLRITWPENNGNLMVSDNDINPWFEVGFEPKNSASGVDNLAMSSDERKKCPIHMRIFFPLIRQRFDLRWTSRWNNPMANLLPKADGQRANKGPSDDPWWIPRVSLDPSIGTLSSENRYQKAALLRDNKCYSTEFKLRVRTTIPTLLSSVTNSAITVSDDDNDLQTASVRFECSLATSPGEQRLPLLGGTLTTARFETMIVPSFIMRSVMDTARFGLFHEQNHGTGV